MWFFSEEGRIDTDFGEDNSSGTAMQPDHFPNVARPGGGYPEGRGHVSDVLCRTCENNYLVDGSCPQCDWGSKNHAQPVDNYPIDPTEDFKEWIRASKYIPVGKDEPIDPSEFGPDDWHYDIDTSYNPPKFWINYPAQQSTILVSKEELDKMLAYERSKNQEESGQMKLWSNIKKETEYQGWSNPETWKTKLMMDNEQHLYEYAQNLVKQGGTPQDLANWATAAVIGPVNQSALADAQEWNEIEYEDRLTGREDLSPSVQNALQGFDEIFGDDPRADETANVIDESKVNWIEIYESIVETIGYNENAEHEAGIHNNIDPSTHPLCPLCNPENPDQPGDLTIPPEWEGF